MSVEKDLYEEPKQKSLKEKVFDIRNTIGKLSKDKENPFFHSLYFSINSLLDNLQSYLEANRILLTQPLKEGRVYSIIQCLDTGETMESYIDLPQIQDPQKIGSAITYYRRYTLKSLLALSEEDDDGNKASQKPEPEEEKPWLNATDKQGNLNKVGEATARRIASGNVTWKDVHAKCKISKKDKEAIESTIEALQEKL
jgi:hypothetical protein